MKPKFSSKHRVSFHLNSYGESEFEKHHPIEFVVRQGNRYQCFGVTVHEAERLHRELTTFLTPQAGAAEAKCPDCGLGVNEGARSCESLFHAL